MAQVVFNSVHGVILGATCKIHEPCLNAGSLSIGVAAHLRGVEMQYASAYGVPVITISPAQESVESVLLPSAVDRR